MNRVLLLVAAAGCASGSSPLVQQDAGADARRPDAAIPDASPGDGPGLDGPPADAPMIDAVMVDAVMVDAVMVDAVMVDAVMVDAMMVDAPMVDAMVDAPMADAPPDACVPMTRELLVNPALDLSPVGTGWQQTLIDPMYPLITGDGALAEHSQPYKAWLGGIEGDTGTVTDVLYQSVMIPAGTTQLVVAGVYYVATDESSTATSVYDSASIGLTQTNGTPIVTIRALSNLTPTTAWTAFSHTVTQNLAGQTVRLRMTSSNDFLDATSFFFDTLSIRATYCP